MKALSALLISCALIHAADLPSAESLIATAAEKSGGKAYANASSAEIHGTVDMVGHNITGPVTIYQKGAKTYTVIELAGLGKIEEGFDGQTAWEMNALQGPRIKDGEEKAVSERERLNLLTVWKDLYTSARTVGEESCDSRPAWKIELSPRIGKPEVIWLDRNTMLVCRMLQTVTTALGEITVDIAVGDYRAVEGIQTPFALTQSAMGQSMAMKFSSVKYNLPIADERFAPPAEIRALMDKAK